jgi:hypothetical protein
MLNNRHATYVNVTFWRVRVTIGAVKNSMHILCVFVALLIQHAGSVHHAVICGLTECAIFLHIIS